MNEIRARYADAAEGSADFANKLKLINEAYERNITGAEGLSDSVKQTAAAMKDGSVTTQAFSAQAKAAGAGAKVAAVGVKALSVATNMLVNMVISLAITGIIAGIQKLANASQEAYEIAKQIVDREGRSSFLREPTRPTVVPFKP